MSRVTTQAGQESEVLALLYELLDAHADTIELRNQRGSELRWEIHLDYLRALQRKTREIVARWPPASETEPK